MILIKTFAKLLIIAVLLLSRADKLTSLHTVMQILAFVSFVYLLIAEFTEDKLLAVAFALFGAILLNPIMPINLNTGIRNEIYLITALIVVVWFIAGFFETTRKQRFL